jgi:hypothetical protein
MKQPSDYRLQYACQLHNHHTSPSAMRSDFEHTIHRKAARKIHHWLTKHFSRFAWREMDSGRLEAL